MSFKNYHGEITLNIGDDEDILGEGGFIIKDFSIYYENGQLPRFKCLFSQVFNNVPFLKDTGSVELYLDDTYTIVSDLTIYETNFSSLMLAGTLCSKMHTNELRTRFLGTDLKSAVQSLGYSQKLTLDNPIQGEFFQWNETDNEVLVELLKGARKDSFICITEDEISVVSAPTEFEDAIMGKTIDNIYTSFHEESMKTSQSKVYGNDGTLGSSVFFNSLGFGIAKDYEYYENYAYNTRYRNPPARMYDISYNFYVPYKVGDGIKFFANNIDRKGIIYGKIVSFLEGEVTCQLRIGELSDE